MLECPEDGAQWSVPSDCAQCVYIKETQAQAPLGTVLGHLLGHLTVSGFRACGGGLGRWSFWNWAIDRLCAEVIRA